MTSRSFHIEAPDGRRIAVWRDAPENPCRGPVVICGGFARRMSSMSSVAAYALNNGAVVYRFDSLDHIGLSDGVIADFSLTSMQESLDATLALVAELEERRPISLIATSLAAAPGIRSAVDNPHVAALACLVGVVDVRRTLERVFGVDYYAWEYEQLPQNVRFERYDIDPHKLWLEHRHARWADFSQVKAALSQLTIPIVNLVASEDQWLTMDEVSEAFAAPGGGQRDIVELPYGGHELARNPVAVRLALRHIMARILCDGDLDAVVEAVKSRLPNFNPEAVAA